MAASTSPLPRTARRRFLLAGSAALLLPAAARAADLVPTPGQTEGPFYPPTIPADHDWDLLRVAGASRQAEGALAHFGGRVLDRRGEALAGAIVEIWQCDANGRYIHPGDRGGRPRDAGFQGFGRVVADGQGAYRFRTIKPVPYSGRAAHIHVAVLHPAIDRFVTQAYVAGDPGNARDFLFRGLGEAGQRRLLVDYLPAPEIEPGALKGRFDMVIG